MGIACAGAVTVTLFREDVAVEDASVTLGDEIDPPVDRETPLSEDVRPAVPAPATCVGVRGVERGRTPMLTRLSGSGLFGGDGSARWFVFPSVVSLVGVKKSVSGGKVVDTFLTGGVVVPSIGGGMSVSMLLSFWRPVLRRELAGEI